MAMILGDAIVLLPFGRRERESNDAFNLGFRIALRDKKGALAAFEKSLELNSKNHHAQWAVEYLRGESGLPDDNTFKVGDFVVWRSEDGSYAHENNMSQKHGNGPFKVLEIEPRGYRPPLLLISKMISEHEVVHDGSREGWVPIKEIDMDGLPYAGGPSTFDAVYFEKVPKIH